jgi:hypothetical protein
MVRVSALLVSGLFFALEPVVVAPSGEFDLVKYGMAQGGLVLVLCALLWFYRKDFSSVLAVKDDHIEVLTRLVENATAAQTRSADANDRMARAVETMQART